MQFFKSFLKQQENYVFIGESNRKHYQKKYKQFWLKCVKKNQPTKISTWRGRGKAIYFADIFTDYFGFQSTLTLITIHDGITSWAPLTNWKFADTSTTRWPLSCEVQNQHLNHYWVPSTFWMVVSMEIVILIISMFCLPPEFFYNSKWYKHKDGKNAVLFLKNHPNPQPNRFKINIFLKLSQEISDFILISNSDCW